MTVRTRFAPSPTGRLHLGNVRTAAFNWLFARRAGGAFVLRIEDTDAGRNVPGGEEAILEDLRWLGLEWDEGPGIGGVHGPYRQSERTARYDEAVEHLLAGGNAYPCYCTEEELAEDENGPGRRHARRCRELDAARRAALARQGRAPAIRFAVPDDVESVDVDDVVYGSMTFPSNDIDDFVIRRADGRPTYNFAVVVDDLDMEITHVVRGAGHLSNTPRQALLFDALGGARPVFAHLPTVLAPSGEKLSKREGATAVSELREQGYPPDAVLNYLSLLGWSDAGEREILTREELVHAISLERVGRSDARVDPAKLRWVSARHLAEEELATLCAHVAPFVDADRFPVALERIEPVVDAIRSRLSTYGDVNEHLAVLYPAEGAQLAAARRTAGGDPRTRKVLEEVRTALRAAEDWSGPALGASVRAAGAALGVRGKELFHPVRTSLIGTEDGPDVGKILAAVGKREALRRIDVTLAGAPV